MHPTRVKVKRNGRWYDVGEYPDKDKEPKPQVDVDSLPEPLSLDEEEQASGNKVFFCPQSISKNCFFANMWRYVAVWQEHPVIRPFLMKNGAIRKGLTFAERKTAEAILEKYGVLNYARTRNTNRLDYCI